MAGEEAAARHYEAKGGQVLSRRWRCREGELDLVVALDDMLVFVEVKSRPSVEAAAEAVRPAQWRRLEAAACRYVAAEDGDLARPMRFDLFLVGRAGTAVIENASLA
ncbi:MAG TPA: YraN family protein [Paracoccaceae bacterium]|nr:YraN family protein [Paracoccaceae bacterium]